MSSQTQIHNPAPVSVITYIDHPLPFITIDYVTESHRVVLFFNSEDGHDPVERAESWLRDALDKVQLAKSATANDQPARTTLGELLSDDVLDMVARDVDAAEVKL